MQQSVAAVCCSLLQQSVAAVAAHHLHAVVGLREEEEAEFDEVGAASTGV